jgi:hypothetical protein
MDNQTEKTDRHQPAPYHRRESALPHKPYARLLLAIAALREKGQGHGLRHPGGRLPRSFRTTSSPRRASEAEMKIVEDGVLA